MDNHDKALDSADGEDIPSDFFDDFSREDFVEGLSVIDSWDDGDKDRNRKRNFDSEEHDVDEERHHSMRDQHCDRRQDVEERYSERENGYKAEGHTSSYRRSVSKTKLDDYIKPGSRRDPNKTNEAIRRDKEVKVKEHLAKHLESSNDIRPPGTELDDFFNIERAVKKKKSVLPEEAYKKMSRSRSREYRERQHRVSPKQRTFKYEEHWKNSNRSSQHPHHSPRRHQSRSWRPSPSRSYRRYSPYQHSTHQYSPRRSRPSRSPARKYSFKSRRSSSAGYKDNFLYPNAPETPAYTSKNSYERDPGSVYIGVPTSSYAGAPINEFSIPGSSYTQDQVYAGSFSGYDGYTGQSVLPTVPEAQPVHVSVMNEPSAPIMNLGPSPSMVPAPTVVSSANTSMQQYDIDKKSPYDALAQLVADGKLSQEDYLKLAPNRGGSMLMDDKTRVMVLSRCDEAIGKLCKLVLPNQLIIDKDSLDKELKTPKYCSPLKRQSDVEFQFTKAPKSLMPRQNKQLLDSIISCIGFEQTASKMKRKNKDMKDAAVQTTKPYCDVCEIRQSTEAHETGTSIDPDHFCSTVHTQVLEQDLLNSKSIFNPSGSVGVSEPISIAHLTPAQLVSQLAARAKTFKQTESTQPQPSNQFGRRNPPNNYDDRGGGRQYHYSNYRY